MTKSERLQELKEQEQAYKILDKYFDAGWKQFVKEARQENAIANKKLLSEIEPITGKEFIDDLLSLMKDIKEKDSLLTIVTSPEGMELNDSRYTTITKVWIKQRSTSAFIGGSIEGSLCIQIAKDRWIKINYIK